MILQKAHRSKVPKQTEPRNHQTSTAAAQSINPHGEKNFFDHATRPACNCKNPARPPFSFPPPHQSNEIPWPSVILLDPLLACIISAHLFNVPPARVTRVLVHIPALHWMDVTSRSRSRARVFLVMCVPSFLTDWLAEAARKSAVAKHISSLCIRGMLTYRVYFSGP